MKIWTKTTKDLDISMVLKMAKHRAVYATYENKKGEFRPAAGQLININSN